jgi:dTDP-4-dehydrorhamnose reductase
MAVEVAEKDLRGLYHASGRERISRYEFAKQIAKTYNLNSDLVKPVKMSQLTAWIAKRPKDSSLNTGKIEKQLKTKPLNITEGLNKMKEEMKT